MFWVLPSCNSSSGEISYEFYKNDSLKSKTYFKNSNLLVREEYFENGQLHKKYVVKDKKEVYHRRHLETGQIAGGRMSIKVEEIDRNKDSIRFKVWPEYLDDDYEGFMIYVTDVDPNLVPSPNTKYILDSDTTFKEYTIPVSQSDSTYFSGILAESSRTGEGDTLWVGDGSQGVFRHAFDN